MIESLVNFRQIFSRRSSSGHTGSNDTGLESLGCPEVRFKKESYPKICHKYVLSSSLRDLNCFRPIRVRIKRPKTKLRIRFFSETGTRGRIYGFV
jgi:hypothetical protein